MRIIPAAITAVILLGTTVAAAQQPLPDHTPWDLSQLRQTPDVDWLDRDGRVWSLMYDNVDYRGEPTQVFAYYATPGTLEGDPSADENLPAVVLLHGGGGRAFAEWAELWAKRGYAAIAIDMAGRGEEGERTGVGGPDQKDHLKFGVLDHPVEDQWCYHAIAAGVRANSLLRSFDAVDSDRVAVTGISWGGWATCIVASIDDRFAAAVPVYGCGFLHENSKWLETSLARIGEDGRRKWTRLYDPSQYLGSSRVPMFFVNGTNDFAYPLDSYMKSYHLVPSKKNLRIEVNMGHSHPAGWAPDEIGWFVDEHLGLDSPPLPQVAKPDASADGVEVQVHAAAPAAAHLHYTTGTGPVNQREWQALEPSAIDHGTVRFPAVPDDATAWFINVTDDRGATVSSEVTLID